MNNSPEQIYNEYLQGERYKAAIGSKGLFEQIRINERFFIGDHWHGAAASNERPLVRHNLIKRIGDYKMSVLTAMPVNVAYSAEGVPNTAAVKSTVRESRKKLSQGISAGLTGPAEKAMALSALNDYFGVTSARLKLNSVLEKALRNAYISGTGIVYTYWDASLKTGLYADWNNKTPIKGDIKAECIPVENVIFGDAYLTDIEEQPYILLKYLMRPELAAREAEEFSGPKAAQDILNEKTDANGKIIVITKLYKVYENGEYKVMAIKSTEKAIIRPAYFTGLRKYPIAAISWERVNNSAYGESEITNLIPNQIAINRMITAGVWSAMAMGMPTMIVNGDVVGGEITNDPGQIIKVYGSADDIENAVHFVSPPDYSGNYKGLIEPLIENTLAQSGANPAALGDVAPNNTSAILALRNAAQLPLQQLQNRYYDFVADIAKIWAEFWITMYGNRKIRIDDENGSWYYDFDAEKYKDLLISAKVLVQAGNVNTAEKCIETLDKLLEKGVITAKEYLERLPENTVPNLSELLIKNEEVQL